MSEDDRPSAYWYLKKQADNDTDNANAASKQAEGKTDRESHEKAFDRHNRARLSHAKAYHRLSVGDPCRTLHKDAAEYHDDKAEEHDMKMLRAIRAEPEIKSKEKKA